MILKFDLEKAYDRLEWSFVMSTLICLGIPEELREIIHLCISSGSMRINWNENVSDSFNSSRARRPHIFLSLHSLFGEIGPQDK